MITTTQTISFRKRFRELERSQAELDFKLSELMRDLRAACGSESSAVAWLVLELGMTELQSKAYIARGALVDVVPDVSTWNRLGGYEKLRALESVPTKRAQVEIVEKAKSQNLQVATVVRREREAGQKRDGVEPVKVVTPREDAEALAKFVLRNVPRAKWTPFITSIVARHADLTSVLVRKRAA